MLKNAGGISVMSPTERDPIVATADDPRSRRDLLRASGVAAVAGVLAVLGISSTASAKNGSPVRAGEKTTASKSTSLESKRGPSFVVRNTGGGDTAAVRGVATSQSGTGVLGEATSNKGESSGIRGTSESPDAAAGLFIAGGGGTAVDARAGQKNGVALRTKGRIEVADRSGITAVSGGAEFVIPVAGGLGNNSLVLATLQDHNPGIHVESASVLDADDGTIVVHLNQALPQPAKVGWIVLD
jgi:hypothetical protein